MQPTYITKWGQKQVAKKLAKIFKNDSIFPSTSHPKMDLGIKGLRHATIADFWWMSQTKYYFFGSALCQTNWKRDTKKISKPMHRNECSKVSNGTKKGRQNWCQSGFWSMSVLMVFLGHAWLKWSRSGHTQMAQFGGYVREPKKGEQATHAC